VTGEIDSSVILVYLAATSAVLVGSKFGISLSSTLNDYSYRKILFVSFAAMGLILSGRPCNLMKSYMFGCCEKNMVLLTMLQLKNNL